MNDEYADHFAKVQEQVVALMEENLNRVLKALPEIHQGDEGVSFEATLNVASTSMRFAGQCMATLTHGMNEEGISDGLKLMASEFYESWAEATKKLKEAASVTRH